jgi:hypothetical protein
MYQVQAVLERGTHMAFVQVFTTPEKAEEWAQKLQIPVTLSTGETLSACVFQSHKIVELMVIE